MVVIHNYAESQKRLAPDSLQVSEIDDDKAYTVGIWVVSLFMVLLLLIFVAFAILRSKNNEQIAQKANIANQGKVLGEKNKTSDTKATVQTEIKTQKTNTSENIQNLERPLTNDEILTKSKTLPGSLIHAVAVGESLYTIGAKYNIDWREIAKVSNLAPPYSLTVGQKIIIPKGG